MNNKDILKYIDKLLNKKNYSKKRINLNNISKIYLKEKRKKDKIKIMLFNDFQKIDDFEANDKILLRYINSLKALRIDIPFKTYGRKSFLFKYTDKLYDLNKTDYLLTNDIIKHASGDIKKAIKIFEIDYKFMTDKKILKVPNSIFKVNINNREIKLFYNDFEIKKDVEKEKFLIKCKRPKLLEKIKGNEEKIFEHVYVDIKKCPLIIRKNVKSNQ